MPDAVAPDAANTNATQRRPVGEHGHNSGYCRGTAALLDAIYDGRPFPTVLRDLGLTSNQVWGLTKTDQEWAEKLDTALNAARRSDLKHGTNAAYKHGWVCHECREHQSIRMGRNLERRTP